MPPALLTSLTMVPMESIFTAINNLATQTVSTSEIVAGAIAAVIFLAVGFSCRFKAGTMIITFLICSFCYWAVGNMDVGKKVTDDTLNVKQAAPASQAP
ncbi:MAG: hypothetical protein L0G49_02085 [Luteococcus sp.]|uniref:hypothetical protein n=1 Tax=Luteococcus sp. TaxID=1969402 RepID=UPI002648E26E|nr:hypothetical protein [Luteococcus sp.]MDN5562558.1 hypothetical protein [Luteococcus sp.]